MKQTFPQLPKSAIAVLYQARDVLREQLDSLEKTLGIFLYANGHGAANGTADAAGVLAKAITMDETRRAGLAAKAKPKPHGGQNRRQSRYTDQVLARRRISVKILNSFSETTPARLSPELVRYARWIGALVRRGYLKPAPGAAHGFYLRTGKVFDVNGRRFR